MGTFNPLVIILKENKLTGPNYIHRNRNLDIVLTAKGHKYVLTMVCPPQPPKMLLNKKQKPIRIGLRLMRLRDIIFWLLCQIYCNISINI